MKAFTTLLLSAMTLNPDKTRDGYSCRNDVIKYAVKLTSSTRPNNNELKFVSDWVSWGAGPRASQYLILGAKARAVLDGRYTPTRDDVKAVSQTVLRHRIVTNFNAEADGIKADEIIRRIIDTNK